MIRNFAIAALAVLFFLATPISKKDQILLLSKKYFPENYIVIKEYNETSINEIAQGDSLKDYILNIATIVHEGYHNYQDLHSSYFDPFLLYRINDSLSFPVKNFKTFPSIEINNIVAVPVRKKIFRYDTYVNAKDKYLVTQQFGILGLLEECIAYYHSFSTDIALFNYYKDKYEWKNADIWITYLGNMASYRYAITEFQLFISWYMQYAKANHFKTYQDIVSNKELKKLFMFLEKENTRLTLLYDQHRATILSQFGTQLQVRDNFIYNNITHYGKGLYDKEVKDMTNLLNTPEHKILEELRK